MAEEQLRRGTTWYHLNLSVFKTIPELQYQRRTEPSVCLYCGMNGKVNNIFYQLCKHNISDTYPVRIRSVETWGTS